MIVIIEEADALTDGAANALLKTLEEPPAHVLFILMTTMPEELPTTIRSRCQRVSFQATTESVRHKFQESYLEWKDELLPFLLQNQSSFSKASSLAESLAAENERFPSLFEFLKGWWHDLAVCRESGDPAHLLLPGEAALLQKEASRKDIERLFADLDLILETEKAIEGNANKTLALERLFAKLGS
jgi:hypothetical protein